jgi:murein DD-endopeptidase MepM/ murein hydrolase activator NlpD
MRRLIFVFCLCQCVHTPELGTPPSTLPHLGMEPRVSLEPARLVNGAVGKVTLQGPSVGVKDAWVLRCPGTKIKETPFFLLNGAWVQLLPVDFNEKPKVWTCEAVGEGKLLSFKVPIDEGLYPSETLRVAPRKTRPLAMDQKRISREFLKIRSIYASSMAEPTWSAPVAWPIQSPVTSPFGSRRIYNGHLASYHGGLDLRAPVGTSIHAPLRGKVVLAEDLFYTGKTVILDHGMQFFSLYAHLNEIHPKVKEGVGIFFVEPGEFLGEAGSTGRVTGPHLHWQLMLQGIKVSPLTFMALFGVSNQPTL